VYKLLGYVLDVEEEMESDGAVEQETRGQETKGAWQRLDGLKHCRIA
jgi:hypothetical protein